MASRNPGNHICVVGAGTFGLNAAKNLLEQGLEVTIFERWAYMGGNWHPSANPDQVAALEMTTKNTSKQVSSFTDFPYPDSAKTHPTAAQVQEYLDLYAKKFDLHPHIKYNTQVVAVERDEPANKWTVTTRDPSQGADSPTTAHSFDRVVVVTGMLNLPNMPKFKGSELFTGSLIHSRQFRDASQYKGKNVILVGIGASAVDIQSFLVSAGANKVYLSHRGSFVVLPRTVKGKAFDHDINFRLGMIIRRLASWAPVTLSNLFTMALRSLTLKSFPVLKNSPAFAKGRKLMGVPHRVPMFDNNLAKNMASGKVTSVQGIDSFVGPKSVRLTDGTVLDDIDAVVVASGYHYDFSLIKGSANPTDPSMAPDGFTRLRKGKYAEPDETFPRLYHGFISEQYSESLAFIGTMLFIKPPFVVVDLENMALSVLWAGGWPVPTKEEMRRDIDKQYDYVVRSIDRGPIPHPGFRWKLARDTHNWLNDVAGTGVTQRLGCWGAEGWKFWWQDRKFYSLVMGGLDTPYVYRLFNTGRGRKAWPGARKAIEKVNEDVKKMAEDWKKEEQAKKDKKV
ncbi:flavin-binding monooxygenase-like-domain-containing protein [Coniochaeta sp. 2T2.1]|nr:flavin-binding monooxygenase-like-domain-containing protein [Coniochaeta sp. 2T2.1]